MWLLFCVWFSVVLSVDVVGEVSLDRWMEDFSDLLSNLTLWDISLPGAHDSMTSVLSSVVADHANDLPSFLSGLLHDVLDPNSTDAHWLRNQSVTQGWYV